MAQICIDVVVDKVYGLSGSLPDRHDFISIQLFVNFVEIRSMFFYFLIYVTCVGE